MAARPDPSSSGARGKRRPAAARRDERPAAHRARRPHRGHEASDRRTQAERTAETTAKLLEATAECLAERGYANTSTTEICRRAGVSRGAMLHHFPSKAVLVAAACEHIFDRRVEEFRDIITRVPQGGDRLAAAIDITWQTAKSDTYSAWYELIMAGRTDPDLRPHVALVAARMAETARATWNELFEPFPASDPAEAALYDAAPELLFAVLDGLAMTRMSGLPGADVEAERVLGLLKLAAVSLVPIPPEENP